MTSLEPLLILIIGLIPAFLSLLLIRKAETRARARLQTAINAATNQSLRRFHYALSPDHEYVEGIGYVIGNFTCRFNARSAYLRCAINPSGPCRDCPFYEAIEVRPEAREG